MSRSMAKRQHAVNTPTRRTPAADALSGLVVEVLRVADQLRAAGDEMARPDGLTSAQWRVMDGLDDGPSTVAQIARGLGLARQSVQRVADTVVAGRFATYLDNPADRRAQLLALTESGRAALTAIQARQVGWANVVATSLDPSRIAEATSLLHDVAGALAGEPGDGSAT